MQAICKLSLVHISNAPGLLKIKTKEILNRQLQEENGRNNLKKIYTSLAFIRVPLEFLNTKHGINWDEKFLIFSQFSAVDCQNIKIFFFYFITLTRDDQVKILDHWVKNLCKRRWRNTFTVTETSKWFIHQKAIFNDWHRWAHFLKIIFLLGQMKNAKRYVYVYFYMTYNQQT